MKSKILYLLGICVLCLSLVACSNKKNTQTEEFPKEELQQEDLVSEKTNKEEILFDKDVIIVDGDITVTVQGKSKVTPGESIGYMYKVSNMSNENIEFYVKDVEVDGVSFKTDLNESTKMPLQSLTDFSTQMTFMEITSLEDLKNTKGTFCIKTSEGVDEYKFELE